jgi:hypothetical protein
MRIALHAIYLSVGIWIVTANATAPNWPGVRWRCCKQNWRKIVPKYTVTFSVTVLAETPIAAIEAAHESIVLDSPMVWWDEVTEEVE